MERKDDGAIVVGGGLAGLTAALCLARRGLRVTLFEKGSTIGGRARTEARDGYLFNMGPHALYRGGPGTVVLQALGIPVKGNVPKGSGGHAAFGGRIYTLPVGMASLLTTGLLDLRDKAELARLLATVPRLRVDDATLASMTMAGWLEARRLRPRVRALLEALVRVTTYGKDLDRLSAGAALRQLQAAQRASVLYLDGGWQSLVDALAEAAKREGVTIRSHTPVAAVERESKVTGVRLADGARQAASAVIVAAGPREAAALVDGGEATSLWRWGSEARPVLMASLDIALSRLPRPRSTFALGIDRPLYFSVHSATARLAPEGGVVLHAARYLGAASEADAEDVRRELEALVDLVQPGWRDAVVHTRLLPHLTVAHDLPAAAIGGLAGRPGPAVPEVPGLFVAGDWVGRHGLLADASLASAQAAAEAAAAMMSGRVRAA